VWDYEGDDNNIDVWQVGAGYENGPYGLDVNYTHVDNDWAGDDESADYFKVAGKYILGPGIRLSASVFHTAYDQDNGPDRDVTGGLMGVGLSF
jgi:predicted porin